MATCLGRGSLGMLLALAALAAVITALWRGVGGRVGEVDEARGPDFFRDSRRETVAGEPAEGPDAVLGVGFEAAFDEIEVELASGARAAPVAAEAAQLFATALGARARPLPVDARSPWTARRAWIAAGWVLFELENGELERELTLYREASARGPAASLTLHADLDAGRAWRVSLRLDRPEQPAPTAGVEVWRDRGGIHGLEVVLAPEPQAAGEPRRLSRQVVAFLAETEAARVLEVLAAPFARRLRGKPGAPG